MSDQVPRRTYSVARALAWVFGSIALLATGWLIYLLIVLAIEWPTYVGHESSTARAILGVVGVAPFLVAWTLFLIPFSIVWRNRHAGKD